MFHILTYGKGIMPAHAVQLEPRERWAVVLRVRVLQNLHTEYPKVSLDETIKVYQGHCAACHGMDGAGTLLRGKLPNLPDFSSLAWQLAKTNLEISNRIEFGDEPLMPAFRYRLARDQILALAIYIRSFAMKTETGPAPKAAPLPNTAGLEPVQIYRAYCLACHNVDGKGGIVRPGMPDIPDFTLAAWQAAKKNDDLAKSILKGGKFMPPMKDKLAPADAERMVQFIRSAFKDGKTIALESPVVPITKESVPPVVIEPPFKVPPIVKEKIKPETVSPELAERLRTAGVLYRQYCIVCHGPDGMGMSAMRAAMPALPDFTKVTFRDQHSDAQILISILDGKGTLMPANRGRVSEGQARDLVAFIRAFAPPGETIVSTTPSEFQQEFEKLQRQWEALEREIRALKKAPEKQ
jgi:mono/diheme cytochrome c family protein